VNIARSPRLSRPFYVRDSVTVARGLLGQRLVRVLDGLRLGGLICETEAYGGTDDPASHAFRRTDRSAIMYGPPGFAYVYFIYGVHHCLNAVTEPDGVPGAVLIRALLPGENLAEMRRRRGLRESVSDRLRGIADGPGKLCQALGITLGENGLDLTDSDALFVEQGVVVPDDQVVVTPRIGVRGSPEALSRPWRFYWPCP
jgi:DNA-3-methyladenine glycosylase